MLFKDITSVEVSNVNKIEFEIAHRSFKQVSKISEKNLSSEEVKALNNLVKKKHSYSKGRQR